MSKDRLKPRYRVAILAPTATDWSRQVLRGVAAYAQEHGPWDYYVQPKGFEELSRLPQGWSPDGLIVRMDRRSVVRAVRQLKLPTVSISWMGSRQNHVPIVAADEVACGRLAAEHYLERGFRNVGYVGSYRRRDYAEQIGRTFIQVAENAACTASVFDGSYEVKQADPPHGLRARLAAWLKSLPTPVGILTWDAEGGRELVASCAAVDLKVPEQVAVLCAEHDHLLSQFAPVPLSFIDQAPDEIGYRAAELLGRLMRGRRPPKKPIYVQPRGVSQRRSTDTYAVDDPVVATALTYIQENLETPIGVADLVQITRVSRSTLENRFADQVGATPYAVIRRAKMQHARRLLLETRLSVFEISERCGFAYAPVFVRNFRAEFGLAPGNYRTKHAH